MHKRPTRSRIATAAALVIGFVLLAAALNQFQLASGLRFESRSSEYLEVIEEVQRSVPGPWTDGFVLGWLVSVLLALSIILFFVGLIRKESRLSTLLLVLVSLPIIWLVAQIPPPQESIEEVIERGQESAAEAGGGGIVETMDQDDAVDITVARPDQSNPIGWLVAAAAAVGLVIVLRPSLPRRKKRSTGEVEGNIARSAAEADEAILRGEQVLAVVVRCYREVLEAYQDTRFAGRAMTLTPREVAARLEQSGVPATAAEGLTTLFERARYGAIELTTEEEAQAIRHLKAITGALGAG
ncbi:MAG: DUF4129 domain-containing protein [Spirochaetales bacterium]